MEIEHLQWDSSFFGLRVGKLFLENIESFNANEFIAISTNLYDLVYVIALNNIIPGNILKNTNLELVDIMLTMSRNLKINSIQDLNYEFRTYLNEKELAECYKISEQTSSVSRFYNEPLIGKEKTIALYRKWVDNALKGDFSDGLFIAKDDEKIVGIHLIRTNKENSTGIFTLTGIHDEFRGKGIGNYLWNCSFKYWAEKDEINKIISPFSFRNIPSHNFHLKMGFNKIIETRYIYHFKNIGK